MLAVYVLKIQQSKHIFKILKMSETILLVSQENWHLSVFSVFSDGKMKYSLDVALMFPHWQLIYFLTFCIPVP